MCARREHISFFRKFAFASRARAEVSRADASSICMLTGFGGIAAVSACSAMREGPGISPGEAFAAFASPDLSAAVAASAREESARLDERIKGIFPRLQLASPKRV